MENLCVIFLKIIITRVVFALHVLIVVSLLAVIKDDDRFFYLSSPILLLFFEGIIMLNVKAYREWEWFCPSVFLYLISTVPSIWFLELQEIESGLKCNLLNLTSEDQITNDVFEYIKEDLDVDITEWDLEICSKRVSEWITMIELSLMLILVIGRWMLPKGSLTRDQLSQLLLVYIATVADIVEFFDSFDDKRITKKINLVYVTLGVWTWSLIQFIILPPTIKSKKSQAKNSCCSNVDVQGIIFSMILQDGPFLIFRLTLIFYYRIITCMNIFFTNKNILVILLQSNRLFVVHTEIRKERNKKYNKMDVSNISIIFRNNMCEDEKENNLQYNNKIDKDRSRSI